MEREPGRGEIAGGMSQKTWSDTPQAFLIPGVFGDDPQLVHLRKHLCGTLNLELVEIPDVMAQGCVLTDMVATGKVIADEIAKRCPHGDVSLVGFSFGASAALEVAAQLIHRERRVAFLGILDGPFGADVAIGRTVMQRALTTKGIIKKVVVNMAGSIDETRRAVLTFSSAALAGTDRSNLVRRAVLTHLRSKALRGWTPPQCEVPGLHVFTGQYGSLNRELWADLCPGLEQIQVNVHHEHLLDETLEAVAAALTNAIGRLDPPHDPGVKELQSLSARGQPSPAKDSGTAPADRSGVGLAD